MCTVINNVYTHHFDYLFRNFLHSFSIHSFHFIFIYSLCIHFCILLISCFVVPCAPPHTSLPTVQQSPPANHPHRVANLWRLILWWHKWHPRPMITPRQSENRRLAIRGVKDKMWTLFFDDRQLCLLADAKWKPGEEMATLARPGGRRCCRSTCRPPGRNVWSLSTRCGRQAQEPASPPCRQGTVWQERNSSKRWCLIPCKWNTSFWSRW